MIRSKIAMGFVWALLALVLHVVPGVVAPAHAQGSRKDDIVFNSRGIPLAGATVRVCAMPATGQPCSPLALIYSDAALTQALANPTTTDGLGNYFFYAAPGKYEIEISGPGITTKQIPNIILPNDPASPSFSAVSAFSLNLSGNLTVNGNTSVVGNLASGTLNLSNQSTPPGAAGSGTVNMYTKTADKRLYYKDDTGTETGPILPGAATNVTNTFTAPQNFDADACFKGPNPVVCVTRYGARAVNPNTTPAATGLTANCNSVTNPTQVTISSASSFQNGDGVILYGCGAAHTMTAPSISSVTPIYAQAGTRTGYVVNGPSGADANVGSTTICYKAVSRDKAGGLTAASAEVCTSQAQATLGAVAVAISTLTRSNDVATITTSAPHSLKIGCSGITTCGYVAIAGTSDSSFHGRYTVASVADSTHFTISNLGLDTRQGATTSATGGTVTVFNGVRVSLTAGSGASPSQYIIYKGASGAETLYNVTMLQGANVTDLTFDDYGSNISGNMLLPPYYPNTPPSSATSDNLSTTIASGAGTTTLTLATQAGTTINNQTIRIDACPGFLAAAQAINSGGTHAGTLTFPAVTGSNTFVFNSYCNASGLAFTVAQNGPLTLNETIEMGLSGAGDNKWQGDLAPQFGSAPSSTFQPGTTIFVGTAQPGLYFDVGHSTHLSKVTFMPNMTNGAVLALIEGGFNITVDWCAFVTGQNSTDYSGIGLYLRAVSGQGPSSVHLDYNLFSAGNGGDTASDTPALFCKGCGIIHNRAAYFLHRGAMINGGPFSSDFAYINGGGTPLFTFAGGSASGFSLRNTFMDTIAQPVASLLAVTGGFNGIGQLEFVNNAVPSSFMPSITGLRMPVIGTAGGFQVDTSSPQPNRNSFGCINALASDGIFGTNNGAYDLCAFNTAIAAGPSFPIFVNGQVPSQPTCTVSSGGSLSVGAHPFSIVPVWWNAAEGMYSPQSASGPCTTTSGNQTITLSWTQIPGNPQFIRIYDNNSRITATAAGNATSIILSSETFNGNPANPFPAGGPTMLMPGTQGIAAPIITLAGSTISSPASGFSAARTISFPDNNGIVPVSSYQNSAYDNATRANGPIGSNWTVTNNGINIASNNFVGTVASANDIAYWAVNTFSAAQFSQVTLTALNGTTDFPGTAVLLSGSGSSTHGYNCVEDTTNIFIQKITGGSSNTTLTSAATTGAAGDILRLEVDFAGNLTCYKNGVSTLTVSDTTYTSGSPGLFLFGTVATSKNWSGGNLHPLAHLDTEQDWTRTQHFTQGIALGGASSESFNNNPRAEQNVFLPGALTSTWTGATWTIDKAVTVTRVQVQAKTAPSGCTTNAVVRLTDGTTPVNVTIAAAANDSGPITQNYAAGASLTVAVQTAAAGCTTSPADANVVVQYRMQ